MSNLPTRILALISRKDYKPLRVKALTRKLGLPGERIKDVREALRQLLEKGQVELTRAQAVQRPRPQSRQADVPKVKASKGEMLGVFRKAAAGHGFVRPSQTKTTSGVAEDIFIPPRHVGDAASGDEVLVRLRRGPGRRAARGARGPSGEIVRILERATHQFVGTYFEQGGESFVRVDGTSFAEPIYVGDPGAKGAQPGDKLVFEMIRFPSPAMRGEGVITEVLGPHGQPGVDTLSIIRAFELPDAFPDDVLDEARRQAEIFDEADLGGREDFTDQVIITIDPVDARDFDDAISLTFDRKTQHWNLGVHIADVGHFAPPGSRLDREARNRGTSVYLPQRVIPMFPEIISNGLASLQQGRVRYVKSALIEFTGTGQRVSARFANAAIRNRRRFSYEEVSACLKALAEAAGEADMETRRQGDKQQRRHKSMEAAAAGDGVHPASSLSPCLPVSLSHLDPEISSLLIRMRELAMILRRRRYKRGSLELSLPETALQYDKDGRVTGAVLREHDVSHQIIEEFMLAANEAVAQHLADAGVPFLRRTHAPPNEQKLKDYAEFVAHLGYRVDKKRATDRFQLQRVLAESAARPEVYAVHYALLRSLKQAEYSPAAEEHYALASPCYCHFTSPIRRYPDLTVHRLLDRLHRHGRARSDEAELVALGEHCSFTERRAEKAERELVKLKLLAYLSDRIGVELEIIITGVEEYGFFGMSPTLPVEGLVRVSTLADDYYHFDALSHTLLGRRTKRRYRLGDRVNVVVARVDLERRLLDFRVGDTRQAGRNSSGSR
jgi:ribonuclease R